MCVSNTFGQSGKAGITVSKATTKPVLKVALFAADAREVGGWGDRANLSGIGRENATRAMIEFMQKHADEELVIVNVGTVGSPAFPVGTVLGISEIISGGAMFLPAPMRLEYFDTPAAAGGRVPQRLFAVLTNNGQTAVVIHCPHETFIMESVIIDAIGIVLA